MQIKKVNKKTDKTKLLQALIQEGLRVFTTKDAKAIASRVGVNTCYVNIALLSLVADGWLQPIKKGVYTLAATTGIQPVHEFEIAMVIVKPAMISHYSAFYHHELTEQVPRDIFITTINETATPQKGKQGKKAGFELAGVNYQIIQLKKEKFFGGSKAWRGEGSFEVTDLERTLLDGLAQPQYCGGLAEVISGFEEKLAVINLERIISYALRLDIAVARRLGWVLEQLGIGSDKIKCLAQLDSPGYRKLDPSGEPGGEYCVKWKLQLNY